MTLNFWNRLEEYVIGTLALCALCVGAFGMASRYLFPDISSDWTDEVVIYLILWGVWISGSRLVHDKSHVSADLILRRLPVSWKRRAIILNDVVGALFSLSLVYAGFLVVELSLALDERSESVLQFPLAWYYLSLPIGMFLMVTRYGISIFNMLNRNDGETGDKE